MLGLRPEHPAQRPDERDSQDDDARPRPAPRRRHEGRTGHDTPSRSAGDRHRPPPAGQYTRDPPSRAAAPRRPLEAPAKKRGPDRQREPRCGSCIGGIRRDAVGQVPESSGNPNPLRGEPSSGFAGPREGASTPSGASRLPDRDHWFQSVYSGLASGDVRPAALTDMAEAASQYKGRRGGSRSLKRESQRRFCS